ncbi:toll/interleukin-1 receptor domain-containing protein [Ralstonia pickettii]|jgi:hypothetical protein|uniref:toll/interleukin-1 receptor domain-containing protein n=1 Tax=Ralstonia pickettii TaxID=329 RepID=UPI0015FCEE6E|nr:TIR domain-containing protein [Ralstonia pickettii]MBB0025865.1 TIR domain-containing protein [Ralstonia pickettii]MBB0036776.1 TIR domain-containing protein [Ralstonia pickettii]MBB0099193.1 TIR domain-containing protein [Ralstonia pickettii]MBB0109111.1 TIR domain-containing protein [Ralstonia pickettii]MBB0130090.1 TIR domain-containing protein [Ralstonia pickettii]
MSSVFISYRREDSEHFAAHLRDGLASRLGPAEVFLDVEDIAAAADWKGRLRAELEAAALLVVVVGPQWLDAFAKRVPAEDQVLWEIQTALELKLTVLPLLISRADLPAAQDLPESIRALPVFNALTLHSTRREDFDKVLGEVILAAEKCRIGLAGRVPAGLSQLLDTQGDMLARYGQQPDILTVEHSNGPPWRVPAVEVLNAANGVDEQRIEVSLDDKPFALQLGSSAAFDLYAKDAKSRGKKFYSTETARLRSVSIEAGGRVLLQFQQAEYFDYVKTNMAMDFPDPMDGRLRDEVHPHGRLEPLAQSDLANHTGISGLVFSNDGKMIIQKRGPQVFTNPNQLCPGYSGVLNANDLRQSLGRHEQATLNEVNVLRELHEELGVNGRQITNRCFMGLSRELLRGGKPELFYAVDVQMSASEILACYPMDREGDIIEVPLRYARARLSLEESLYYRERFEKLVTQLENEGRALLSVTLLTNLAFWVNQNQPARSVA